MREGVRRDRHTDSRLLTADYPDPGKIEWPQRAVVDYSQRL